MRDQSIYVIIVTYNGIKWLHKCLHILSSDVKLHIILIDNGSTDGTIAFIENNYPALELIRSDTNLGFGQANNKGITRALKAGADYVFLLNQDAYIEKDTIRQLVEFHLAHIDYGVLSPQQMNGAGSALDKSFENIVLSKKCMISSFEDAGTIIHSVYFVMAAFWLVSAKCLNKVGVFDPVFFHYGEDSDYLSRVRYHGFKIGVVMNAVGYHDREERAVSDIQQLKMFYTAQLAVFTNINHPFILCFLKVMYNHFKRSVSYIRDSRFDLFKENSKEYFNLIFNKINPVLSARSNNKKPVAITD